MSFLEPRDEISIVNRALSRIGQTGISGSIDNPVTQNKLAGREAKLWYKPTVRRMLEAHHWGFATKRVPLALNATNVRAGEWPYSYAKPADMAFPVVISPYGQTSTGLISYYHGVEGLLASLYGRPLFLYESGSIFSWVGDAELGYVSFDITEQEFTQEFEDILVEFLSAAFARSIAKDKQMADGYEQEAIKKMNSVIAHSLNQSKPRYGDRMSEAELAREGTDPWLAGYTGRF